MTPDEREEFQHLKQEVEQLRSLVVQMLDAQISVGNAVGWLALINFEKYKVDVGDQRRDEILNDASAGFRAAVKLRSNLAATSDE